MKTSTLQRVAPALLFAVIGLGLVSCWLSFLRGLSELSILFA